MFGIDCIPLAGIYWLLGIDFNGDRYMVDVDKIVMVSQSESVTDLDPRVISIIQTTNGTIVEDIEAVAVAQGIQSCERWMNVQPSPPVQEAPPLQ